MSAEAKAPPKISAEKKAEIGIKGFYNIDKKTWIAKTDRAVKQGESKGWIYDRTFGVAAMDRQSIDDFIEANDLVELPEGTLEAAAPSSATAKAKPTSSSGANASPASAKAPGSASNIAKIKEKLAAISDSKSGKFLNVSTMREVQTGKRDLIYNVGLRIAARKDDSQLLSDVVSALGGSPTGGADPPANGEESNEEVVAPVPTSRRITQSVQFGKKIFGTKEAIALMEEKQKQQATTPVAVVAEPIAEGDKEALPEPTVTPVVTPPTTVPVVAPAPQPVRRLEIVPKPAMAPLIKPVAKPSLPFATKTPVITSFSLAKPGGK